MAYKQKSGSPFQRNFGIGKSPLEGQSNSSTPAGKDHDKKHSEGHWEKEENKGTHPKHEKGNKRARVDKFMKEKGIGTIPPDEKESPVDMASPAKLRDVETIDPVTGEIENIGTGVGAVKRGLKVEKGNDRIINANIESGDYDHLSGDAYQKGIRTGTTKINYSDEDVTTRKIYATGANPKTNVTLQSVKGKTVNPDLGEEEEGATVTYSKKPIGKKTDRVIGPRGLV